MMLVLLPFILIGLGASVGICLAAGFGGVLLAGMLVALTAACAVAALVLFVAVLGLFSLFIDREKPQEEPNTFCRRAVCYVMGILTALSRIRLHVSGTELLPREGTWLLVCNHRSNYDPIVTGWALRRCNLAFISKPQNMHIPIAGRFIHKAGYLGIDRDNDRAALRTILLAAKRLKEGRCSYAIYPEGTRSHGTEMLPFRNGALKIAQKAGVPIVVAAVRGTEQVAKRAPWRATDVYLTICRVLDAETVTASKTTELGEEIRQCILSANT